MASVDLRAAWQAHAAEFVAWARAPGHDSYWQFHRDLFLDLLPAPGTRTLDVGCGEGRLTRDLRALGHEVVAIDASSTMIDAARAVDATMLVRGDAAALPFDDRTFDLVVAFMSLQDVDDLDAATREVARVLASGGRACIAVVHPLNSAGRFDGDDGSSPFVIEGSYLDPSFYADDVARGGMEITFVSAHRPIQTYVGALARNGLLVETLREPALPDHAVDADRHRRWQRLPMFLHLRAVRP